MCGAKENSNQIKVALSNNDITKYKYEVKPQVYSKQQR